MLSQFSDAIRYCFQIQVIPGRLGQLTWPGRGRGSRSAENHSRSEDPRRRRDIGRNRSEVVVHPPPTTMIL